MHLSEVSAGRAERERRTGYLCLALLCSGVLCIRGGYEEERGNERRETHVKRDGYKAALNRAEFSHHILRSKTRPCRVLLDGECLSFGNM